MAEEQEGARRTLNRIRRHPAMQRAEQRQRHNRKGNDKYWQGSARRLHRSALPDNAMRRLKETRHVLRSLVAWRYQ